MNINTNRQELAFVTGATSGIGKATALRLAARGSVVGLVGRNAQAGQELTEKIKRTGGSAMFLPADVSKSDRVARAVDDFVRAYGGIDTVVSSAGIAVIGEVTDMDERDWHRIIDTNLTGTFYVARFTIPHMLARGGGSFTAVSSDAGVTGSSGYAAYCASKHGVNGLIRCLALDYGAKGIRANAVCPGFVETPMAELLTPEERELWKRFVPLGRFASPEEVAEAIAHLSSPAAAYTNGMMFSLDGGSTAGYYFADG
jgi:NAD(P)-dependent dehydrogenase (short-subunit alcohol dehydrogenase family)